MTINAHGMSRLPTSVSTMLTAYVNHQVGAASSQAELERLCRDLTSVLQHALESGDDLDAWTQWLAAAPLRWATRHAETPRRRWFNWLKG